MSITQVLMQGIGLHLNPSDRRDKNNNPKVITMKFVIQIWLDEEVGGNQMGFKRMSLMFKNVKDIRSESIAAVFPDAVEGRRKTERREIFALLCCLLCLSAFAWLIFRSMPSHCAPADSPQPAARTFHFPPKFTPETLRADRQQWKGRIREMMVLTLRLMMMVVLQTRERPSGERGVGVMGAHHAEVRNSTPSLPSPSAVLWAVPICGVHCVAIM